MDQSFSRFTSMHSEGNRSPAEEELRRQLMKVIADDCRFDLDVPISAPTGPFFINCVVEAGGRRVGFDVSTGAERGRKSSDWRDAAILAAGCVDAIVHIAEFDVLWHLQDALYLVSRVEPSVFSPRGRLVLERRALPEVQGAAVWPGDERLSAVVWRKENDEESEGADRPDTHYPRSSSPTSHRLDVTRHRGDGRLKPVIARLMRQVDSGA